MKEGGKFVPAANCKFSDTCRLMGKCQESHIIGREIRYFRDPKLHSGSNLGNIAAESSCDHPQAKRAVQGARRLLDSPDLGAPSPQLKPSDI